MAGIITISKGHDASYPWRQIGTEPKSREHERTNRKGVGYYLSPAERGGEPPGIWTGKDVAELGLAPGAIVDRETFEPLYGHHLDPRDPTGETRLGRAPGNYKPAEAIYESLLALEPHATAERRDQLMIEAKSQVRTPDLYWDATFSVSKSISLFHASALANATAAANSGNHQTATAWRQISDRIWDAIMEGNAAALDYLQSEAGQTRAGYHPGGRWEDARQWVIASFRQHTSRDGDPQLHVHNLILHKVRRESDGQWRALDSMSLYRHRPAASAIAALVMENALTREFCVRWEQRRDGHGREIADVSQALMDTFSSRRASIGPLTARLAREYEAQFGRAPDARALASLRQWANHATRRAKQAQPLDYGALIRRWSAHAIASEAGALEPLAPQILSTGANARQSARTTDRPAPAHHPTAPPAHADRQPHSEPLTAVQAARLMAEAVAAVQQTQATWTQADLIRHLGERLPAAVDAMTAREAAALLPSLASGALARQVVMLSAPEWPRVPNSLRRASGESLYTRHGAARYATDAQLDLEARLLSHAQETGAPCLSPATAARLLGASQAQLEAQLRQAHDQPASEGAEAGAARARSGLRLDQAAAAFWVLTSSRRAEILIGPAGSGKTYTVAELARIWQETQPGEIIGLTTSQTAANVLTQAGVTRAHNTARFLGHLHHRREALDPLPIQPGSLIILDEASMMSTADIAAILDIARRNQCKVIVTGDHEQLAAVEGGGAMMMLARRLGYAQLLEPERFASLWERDATLRLRSGDLTVLAEYEEHGRLRGGDPEEAVEQAYRGWLADYLAGLDSVLIARTTEQARELSRRARDDLLRYGRASPGARVRLAAGEWASVGDLVTARRNVREIEAGQPERGLANRDLLQITAIDDPQAGAATGRVRVRRMLDRDPGSGQPQWSAPFSLPRRYLANHANLGYAMTAHAAQGRTTDTAHVLVDGLGDRQGLYVAMSRGRQANFAYCITLCARLADAARGSSPDPELGRAVRLDQERAGLPPADDPPDADLDDETPVIDPVAVLAGIMTRDGSELSATETLERELSSADHLGVLGGIWDDVTRRLQTGRFTDALRNALPDHLAEEALSDPACTWLWRTLREAETIGLDGNDVLRQAVRARDLTGVREIARVLDARIRRTLTGVQPAPPGSWTSRVPAGGPADLTAYLRDLAELMDDRVRRLGEHTATTQPLWALQALGLVPVDATARLDWEHRASIIAAYRERYGFNHSADPIGPEPSKLSPEARAAWHTALAAAGRIDGIDLRHCTDGELWLRRGTYERETAWAPPHVGADLRLARIAGRDAEVGAIRAEHEAAISRRARTAARHRELACRWRTVQAKATAVERLLTEVHQTRRDWESVTQSTRRIAVAADAELHRRHPRMPIAPLVPHPAETTPGQDTPPADRLAELGITLDTADAEIPAELHQLSRAAEAKRPQIEELRSLRLPVDEHSEAAPDLAWPGQQRQRAGVRQLPKQEVTPSERILTEYQERSAAEPEREAE